MNKKLIWLLFLIGLVSGIMVESVTTCEGYFDPKVTLMDSNYLNSGVEKLGLSGLNNLKSDEIKNKLLEIGHIVKKDAEDPWGNQYAFKDGFFYSYGKNKIDDQLSGDDIYFGGNYEHFYPSSASCTSYSGKIIFGMVIFLVLIVITAFFKFIAWFFRAKF